MPFRKSCKITVTNEGRRHVSMLYFQVDWDKVPSLPAHTACFHARYRQSLPAPADGSAYEFLNVKGKGHYVGTVMSVVQAETGWFGEGDDHFWVDGHKPLIEGTGTEDYFNDAWGLHVNDGPYYGVTVVAALGSIGKPAATPALPLLQELAKIPRVRWAAEAAITEIK